MRLSTRGTTKPPISRDRTNWNHPFVRNFLFGAWFNHANTVFHTWSGVTTDQVVPTWGAVAPRTMVNQITNGGIRSNLEGGCIRFDSVNDYLDFGADPIPAAQVTIAIIRRKQDTTARNGVLFGLTSAATAAKRCQVSVPYTDGNVYFDFGGFTAGTTRLTVSGLSFSTTVPERLIFIAGSRGMTMWQNGKKVGSQATANPGRTVDTSTNFRIGTTGVAGSDGDWQDINFVMVINDQWDDALCRAWSAEPYAHLYPEWARTHLIPARVDGVGPGGTSTFPALTVAL